MRLGVLFSSGKDSTNTLWYYLEQGWDVKCLLSILPENQDSWMFQNPSKELLTKQSESLELAIIFQESPGEKEEELKELKKIIQTAKEKFGLQGIAVGAVASDYQHERVSRICEELEIQVFAPLWHKDQEKLLREMVEAGFDIRMTRIAADGLSEEWLGKRITTEDVNTLAEMNKNTGFHTAGEGGEFETIVLDGPIFTKPIHIEYRTRMESKYRGDLIITSIDGKTL